MKTFVSGALAYDRILYFKGHFKEHFLVEKVHALSVSFDIATIDESFGGTGGNIAYTLKLLGGNPLLFGSVGDDYEKYAQWLATNNISDEYVIRVPNSLTSQAHIMTDRDNNQITGFHQGAGAEPYTKEIPVDTESIAIVAPAHPKNMLQFSKHYQESGMKYIFDPGQQVPTFSKEDFATCVEHAWIFVANDYEMSLSLSKLGFSEEELHNKIPVVITTLGDSGSVVYTEGKRYDIGVAPADTVQDPTGAGDAYRAGLAIGLQNGLSIDSAARLAATTASYAIEQQGTQNHRFTIPEVLARHKNSFGEEIAL